MGIVYRAYDPRLRREVALKFLSSDLGDAEAQARFIKEARTASALDHPHNCPVYDIGKTERGRLFIAMAYCSRGSLARRLASGPLPVKEAVRIAIEVADLLEAAHQAGVIHRDIKPANIAFSERGDARVLDFGVAVFGADDVAATSPAGTIAYMSPEQLRGQPADGRSQHSHHRNSAKSNSAPVSGCIMQNRDPQTVKSSLPCTATAIPGSLTAASCRSWQTATRFMH